MVFVFYKYKFHQLEVDFTDFCIESILICTIIKHVKQYPYVRGMSAK